MRAPKALAVPVAVESDDAVGTRDGAAAAHARRPEQRRTALAAVAPLCLDLIALLRAVLLARGRNGSKRDRRLEGASAAGAGQRRGHGRLAVERDHALALARRGEERLLDV